jgi:hypothetical protein
VQGRLASRPRAAEADARGEAGHSRLAGGGKREVCSPLLSEASEVVDFANYLGVPVRKFLEQSANRKFAKFYRKPLQLGPF